MQSVPVVGHVDALRQAVSARREKGERTALVPTMGALHEGHLSLVRLARQQAEHVVVSVFVNPTQFAPGEDLSRYPRTFEEDRRKLEGLADLIYAPGPQEMYPPGEATRVRLSGPAEAGLEDRYRPTHFEGVGTVVAKLFNQAMPDVAVFGEKDYQQLKVIERMVRDLFIPVRILSGATVREASGLALSSRNRFLSDDGLARAPVLYRCLQSCADAIRAGDDRDEVVEAGCGVLAKAGFNVDYLELRDARDLSLPGPESRELRLLAAAWLGETRLIDNTAV